MVGKQHHMCMPAPLHMRDFDTETYITKEEVKYPTHDKNVGTHLRESDATFPTLVRELEDPLAFVPDISLVYPLWLVLTEKGFLASIPSNPIKEISD